MGSIDEAREDTMSVAINSDAQDGKHFEIFLDKTGMDTGKVNVKTWNDGTKHKTQPPDSEQPVGIKAIKAKSDGSKLVCHADVFGSPTVTVAITPPTPNQAPSVPVAISAFLFNDTKTYVVSPTDLTNVKNFIATSGFPVLA
jgi:hypothetical protein